MHRDELSQITEEGVSELGLDWPRADSIFELRILRAVQYPGEAESRQVTNTPEYLDFLYYHVFPLIQQLEEKADVEYWHVLNHGEYLDLRLLIVDENQTEKVQAILAQHSIVQNQLTKWKVYDDPKLGSRLGCQALLRLYHAQSEFVRDLVRSIYWLNEKSYEEVKELISNIEYEVPIYTSHMLLNVFPCNVCYEAYAHLRESEFRFRSLLENGGLPQEAERALDMIRKAKGELQRLLTPGNTGENE